MGWFKPKLGTHGDQQYLTSSQRAAITEAQRDSKDAIFHGACIGCLWRKGNAQQEGLRWCMGCAFFGFTENLPNRCLPEARQLDGARV